MDNVGEVRAILLGDPITVEVGAVLKLKRRRSTVPRWSIDCPNCGTTFAAASHAKIYCSPRCKSEAKAVRYARHKALEYPDGLPEDIALALKDKIAHALGDGYDDVARHLTPEIRGAVFQRDRGRCRACGQRGSEIDHIDGPSSELSNLQLLCDSCHNAKTRSRYTPLSTEEQRERARMLHLRMECDVTIVPCDAIDWSEKEWRRTHRRRRTEEIAAARKGRPKPM